MAELSTRRQVLVVDDDDLFRKTLAKVLARRFEVAVAADGTAALSALARRRPDLMLLDVMMPGMTGLEVLAAARKLQPELGVVLLTAVGDVPTVVEAMRLGALDYLTKPVEMAELDLAVDRALETIELRQELRQHRELQRLSNQRYRLLGDSPAMCELRRRIETVGPSASTVLIVGETGTGKELVARNLHAASPRADAAFVAINCGGVPKELLESEFFGHARGAFTGAADARLGKFELAHRGTLFLDEVGELHADAQTKLLRVLEEREFYPVGETELRRVDVRVIAATHRDLSRSVEEGSFREDLLFRLNVFPIEVPPLRQRRSDIVPLARHFLVSFGDPLGKRFEGFDDDARKLLEEHPWRGNVRELRNLMERVALLEDGAVVSSRQLPLAATQAPTAAGAIQLPPEGVDLGEVERELLRQALEAARWNKTRAAALVGLSPPTFYYRLRKYGLDEDAD